MRVDEITDLDRGQSDGIRDISRVVDYGSSLSPAASGVSGSTSVSLPVVAPRTRDAVGSGSAPARQAGAKGKGRRAPLRVDAQRNLEHVLRAAREVFGESGYGAPMEDVARRARVGVGTVYRRFPSKDVLVSRIAREETSRLAEQARTALAQEGEAWTALERFMRASVASGAGRLLPPGVLAARGPVTRPVGGEDESDRRGAAAGSPPGRHADEQPDAAARELLFVVGELVGRARGAGKLRADVSVGDVLLVIATAAPSLPDARQRSAASARLLEILLEGLRAGHVR